MLRESFKANMAEQSKYEDEKDTYDKVDVFINEILPGKETDRNETC